MPQQPTRRSIWTLLAGIGWPVLIGLAAWTAFYALLSRGVIGGESMRRYFAGHPIEYIETAMFLVGVAALLLKAGQIVGQLGSLDQVALDPPAAGGQPVRDADRLLDHLAAMPARLRNSLLGRRLIDALEHVRRTGTADELDGHLVHLSDRDADRRYEEYSLVRIIIWATPMLGFLGTVIGITMALGGLSFKELVDNPEVAAGGLLAGLSIAFDTTTVALSLSIVLMFGQFLVNQIDTQLQSAVEDGAEQQLSGRFHRLATASDPQLASVQRMAETVLQSSDDLVQRQAQLWQSTIDAAQQRWVQLVGSAGGQLEQALADSVGEALAEQSERMAAAEQAAARRAEELWQQLQQTLLDTGGQLERQQTALAKQGDVMLQVVQATGDVVKLERSLNENLNQLAGAKHFEDTVMSLSAAIHLLNTRLGGSTDAAQQVHLEPPPGQQERAA